MACLGAHLYEIEYINVAAFKTIQIIFLSPRAAESLLPPALSSRWRTLTA
jgi:hypothetical protein